MIFYWINRIILGDTLFGVVIWMSCLLAYLLTALSRRWPESIKLIYFVLLSFGLMIIFHFVVDLLQNFWLAPLGEHMNIIKEK